MPASETLPGTLRRSGPAAQRAWTKAHDGAGRHHAMARRFGVRRRSRMSKAELARALGRVR
jgi:hypothetical protein